MSELLVKYCVLIPSYNNAGTILDVVKAVKNFCSEIIIVNDGSTDNTASLLSEERESIVISYTKNRGKGYALRQGFNKAAELGFTHVITLDSDGQHRAEDLSVLINKILECPSSLVIGSRNMKQENVPGSSNFGNNFSNFWFKFETGIDAPDTQSGYRAYPIHLFQNMRFFTNKYEFEIEVIVRAAWQDIPVEFVPINVYYPPQDERITHFRKVPDFTRISILNTLFVIMAVLYYRPRNFFRGLKKKVLKSSLTPTF